MPASILVRKASGEVLRIDPNGQDFLVNVPAEYATYWESISDPPFPDGMDYIPRRVLGKQKHWDGFNCRNSTQSEIDGYQAFEDADESEKDEKQIRSEVQNDRRERRKARALAKTLADYLNPLYAAHLLTPPTPAQVFQKYRSEIKKEN